MLNQSGESTTKGFLFKELFKITLEDEEITDRILTMTTIFDSNVDQENSVKALSLVRKL